jgi:hypothetical protein
MRIACAPALSRAFVEVTLFSSVLSGPRFVCSLIAEGKALMLQRINLLTQA